MIYAKLVAALVQHWILLTATWCDCRRSLMKAAEIISDWMTLLTDALEDLDRLIAVLCRISQVVERANWAAPHFLVHLKWESSAIS